MEKKVFSTFDISELLSVDISTVQNWIKEEKLKAYKTPGGHRRILKVDFIEFLKRNDIPAPEIFAKTLKLLVLDDEKQVRENIKKIILNNYPDAEVIEASEGFTAGKVLGSEEIDIVLLDIAIPGIDGMEVLKLINDDPSLGSPKVVVISGYGDDCIEEAAMAFGAFKFVRKPFEIRELLEIINECIAAS